MTPILKKMIVGFALGVCTAAIVDIRKWLRWRSEMHERGDMPLPFDWTEAVVTWFLGGFTGALTGAGISATGDLGMSVPEVG